MARTPRPPNIPAPSADGTVVGATDAAVDHALWELVERARSGDREAFGDLYRRYYRPLYRLAFAHLGPGAEDAVAETFLRAWAALPRYRRTGAPFVAWLYGIARHVVADALRARSRTQPVPQVPDRAAGGLAPEERAALAAALQRLPDDQRRVVEMKFLLGLTNAEVGLLMGKSPAAVNAQQWRALSALRRALEDR